MISPFVKAVRDPLEYQRNLPSQAHTRTPQPLQSKTHMCISLACLQPDSNSKTSHVVVNSRDSSQLFMYHDNMCMLDSDELPMIHQVQIVHM